MSDTPRTGMELLRESGMTIGDVVEQLKRENAALRDDNRKLALHTAEQAKELGKLRDQLEEAQDKALRFDIDSVGIERREAEGAELVTLRAELSAAQARISAYTGTIQRLWGRLNPDLEYVEGATVAYGADEIDRLNARITELEAALKGLHDDTADYQRINNIGGYDNHWMKAAREALAKEKP